MTATHVLYYATAYGYYVAAHDDNGQPVKEYRAGNHPGDSQGYLTPKKRYGIRETRPVKTATLKKWAKESAQEMAKDFNIPKKRIAYDQDGADSEMESYNEMGA